MNEQEEYKLRNERVTRWDQYRINHFTYTNNLFIALNIGFLGFFITQSGFELTYICWLLVIQIFTFLFILISFFTGILTVFNRLKDFRYTARLTKKRKKKFEHTKGIKTCSDIVQIESSIQNLKTITDKLGPKAWVLLNIQIWSFLGGILTGTLYMIIEKSVCG